ncbi:MAG TPA: CADD family putative folate metabolism protein [Acidobacteriaceae bacterium]
MSTMTNKTIAAFWTAFEARTAPYNLLTHAFYQAWSRGELTRSDLRAYAAEYWHHVSAFPTYLSALHSRLPDSELRREVLRNLAEEEGTDSPTARPHSDLWMDFAEGMGATRAEVEAHTIQPEMAALLSTFRSAMQEPTPAAALAALYAYESRVPEIAVTKAEGLAQHYNADAATAKYFTLHQTADVAHAAVWRGLIDKQLAADPSAAEAALDSAERAAHALWSALDGIERERKAHH